MRIARNFRSAFVGAALVIGSLGITVAAPTAAQAQGTDARVRVAHFSADAPPIDVYVDGKPKLRNVPFQAMSDYLTLASGTHTFDVRAAGSAATAAPAVTVSQDFAAGKNYTVAAVGALASIQGKVFEDTLATPASGKSRIRVIHATPANPSVDVAVKGGPMLFPKLAFGSASDYAEVAAGSYEIEVRDAGKTAALLTKPVTLQAGGVYTIAAVPAANGGPNLRGFIDVAPSAAPPATEQTAATSAGSTAAPSTAKATESTAKATEAPTTKAAAAETTKAVATTAAPAEATEAAAETEAAPEATEPAAEATDAADDTEAAPATPTTEPINVDTPTTKAAPAGGVDTGFGGLTNDNGAPTPFAALLAVTAAAVGAGLVRRRRASQR